MDFAKIVSTGIAVGKLIPVAIGLVTAVENAMPAGTPGALKLDAVKTAIQSLYDSAGSVEAAFADVWPHLQSLITVFVNVFNSMGLFKKAAPIATPTA